MSRCAGNWRCNGGCRQVVERIPTEVIASVVSANLRFVHGSFNTGVSGAGMHHGSINREGAGAGGDWSHHVLRPESIEVPGNTGPINAVSHDAEVLGQLKIQTAHAGRAKIRMRVKCSGASGDGSDLD